MRKVLLTIFVSAILIAPNLAPVRATTSPADELQAQISDLLAKIEQLKKQLTEVQKQQEVWCHDFNTNLRVGDEGDEIDALNVAFVKEGLLEPGTIEHSSNFQAEFIEETASAVVEFQEKYSDEILKPLGLKHGTGYVGKATRAKLNELYGCKKKILIPPQDETVNWKTYKSDIYSFKVKYPLDWTSKGYWSEDGGFFYIAFGTADSIDSKPLATLRVYPNQTTLNKFIKYFDYLSGTWNNTTLGGLTAKEVVSIGQNSQQFILTASVKNSYGYELSSTVFGDNVDIVRKINSTFQFFDINKTCVSCAAPFISSIMPSSASERATVIINGNGFKSGASVLFNPPEGPAIKKASSVASNGTKLTFVIPVGFAPGIYRVAVTNLDGTLNSNEVNFTVISPNTTPNPTITVLSPNGGDVWEIGKNYQIQFKIAESKSGYADLLIFPENNEPAYVFDDFFENKKLSAGIYTSNWTIPQNVLTGKYTAKVYLKTLPVEGKVLGIDSSDAPFSIVAQ